MTNSLRCIVVDDDEIDRLTTLSLVKRYEWLTVAGVFDSAEAALNVITKQLPDVAFLDVDMPGMSGLELR
ncbi:MAG: DNA-binding response regulator, partial [Flavobacterium psychrophilum]